MATIKLVLFKSKILKRDGSHPIMIRVTHERRTNYISTGFSAHPDEWDDTRCCVKRNYPNSVRVNHLLNKKALDVESIDIEMETIGDPYTLDDLMAHFNRGGQKVKMLAYWVELVERLTNTGHLGNARCYNETLKKFRVFAGSNDWSFDQFNQRRLIQFHEHLKMQGLSTNTIGKHLRTLRAVFNYAIKESLVDERRYPFKNYRIKKEATRKRALPFTEIKKIEEAELDNPQLLWARDLFMFSFYCMGMNFVDMAALKVSDIHEGRIQYRRAKTSVNYDIGIHPKLQELVDDFKKGKSENDYLLPINDNEDEYRAYRNDLSWFNKLIKRLGDELDLSMTLSSYVARHSWATLAKKKGVPISKISEALGHTTERTTQIYLDSFAREDLDEVNELVVG